MIRIASLLLLLAVLPATAQDDIARMGLLPGWRDDARHVAALRIDLLPGWKTYWRTPGEAGIPPDFDWSGSVNVAAVTVHWPVPQVFAQSGFTSVGYAETVTLPLIVTPRDPRAPATLDLAVDIGVCAQVCVPVSARLTATLPPDTARPDARIRAALADRPLSEDEAGVGRVDCTLVPGDGATLLETRVELPPMGGNEYAVLELADRDLWVSQGETRRSGGALISRAGIAAPRGVPVSLDREGLRLTVIGTNGAVDIRGCD